MPKARPSNLPKITLSKLPFTEDGIDNTLIASTYSRLWHQFYGLRSTLQRKTIDGKIEQQTKQIDQGTAALITDLKLRMSG
jgi:hypothetical protein